MSVQQRLLYQDGQLKITVAAGAGAPAVTLIGEIDATNSPALADVLASCRPNRPVDHHGGRHWDHRLDHHPDARLAGRPDHWLDAHPMHHLDGHPVTRQDSGLAPRTSVHRPARGKAYVDVDTGALTFIDVSGMRVLVMPTLPASQRWIRLHNVTPSQRRLLRMMGWFYQPRIHRVPL